jgi:protoheme IX farnesyltransferase
MQSKTDSVELKEDKLRPIRWQENTGFTPMAYTDLSKAKLAALVILTTMCGYALAPGAAGVKTLLWTTLGTTMCVSSANSINQWIEYPFDAQMSRTKNRVLVKHVMSPIHAFSFGVVTAISGTLILYHFVNPITAVLGFSNILLYTALYTPMKRTSIANTWVGAVVGAIPPMMGWTAVTGHLDPGAWLLGMVLYAWQFPHFNALSWNLRADYSKAGYRMMSVVNPALTTRVALRYSLLLLPLGWLAPYIGLTTPIFAYTSTVVSGFMAVLAIRFWRTPNEKTARSLFFSSLIHLPLILALMLVHKAVPEV